MARIDAARVEYWGISQGVWLATMGFTMTNARDAAVALLGASDPWIPVATTVAHLRTRRRTTRSRRR